MNRFHNKYHRHNHHTLPTTGEPDSAHDPIASPNDPFKGDMHVLGQISSTSCITSALSVHGNAQFYGDVNIVSPISYIFKHLLIEPDSTTSQYYFKINSNYNNYPLFEVTLQSAPVFFITSASNIGIGTSTPSTKLQVEGDTRCYKLSSHTLSVTGNAVVGGSLTSDKTSRLGYMQIGYVDQMATYFKVASGNRDIIFYRDDTAILSLSSNNTNTFSGKVGINTTPVEHLTLKGNQSFRNNGYILLDNSYEDTLRIITNRGDSDANQHLYTFTNDGRFVVGDLYHNLKYSNTPPQQSYWSSFAGHTINAISKGSGENLSLTNVTESINYDGPNIRMFRANGDFADYQKVQTNQSIGNIRAYGYNDTTFYNNKGNATIRFFAANDYSTSTSQGGYITFETTSISDTTVTPQERLRIGHNGYVSVGFTSPSAIFTSYTASVVPSIHTINTSTSSSKISLMLSDTSITANSKNLMQFTATPDLTPIGYIGSNITDASAAAGGSLVFGTTHVGNVSPYERMRLNSSGDVGIGSTSPVSRLHIHDDNKTDSYGNGSRDNVMSISTRNNINGILLSSANIQTQLYNDNANTYFAIKCPDSNIYLDGETVNIGAYPGVGVDVGFTYTTSTSTLALHKLEADILFLDGIEMSSGGAPAPSDIALKTNVQIIENSLDKINSIRGVTFEWINKQKSDIGVIAQEVEQILPEAVDVNKNGYKVVYYDKLIPLLIESVKELKAEIDKLKSMVKEIL